MELMLITHEDGTKAAVISHNGWWARKLLAEETKDELWREAKVQFPIIAGEPRILAIQPGAKSEDAKPKRRMRKKKEAVPETVSLSDSQDEDLPEELEDV